MKSEASNNISPKIFIDTQLLLKSTVYSPLKKRIDSSTRRISRWHGEVSKGVGNAGLTTGIIGTALGALNSGVLPNVLGGMFGGLLFDVHPDMHICGFYRFLRLCTSLTIGVKRKRKSPIIRTTMRTIGLQ